MRGRALASVMRGLAAAWELSESDRVAFDPGLVSTVEPLAALTCGCTVIFAGNLDGAGLGSALASAGSTAAHLSEDSWTRLLDAGWNAPPGFRAIVASPPAIQTVRGLLRAGARVLCVLVPTDGGAWYATAELRGPDAPLKAIPLPNLEIEVVDAAGAPALPGAAGELVLSGPAAPSDPDAPRRAAARHLTGDLVRAGLQGAPIVAGRVDGGSIRSLRSVSAAPAEAILRGLPGIDAAAVVCAGVEGLVAFCTPQSVDAEEIMGTLRGQLRIGQSGGAQADRLGQNPGQPEELEIALLGLAGG